MRTLASGDDPQSPRLLDLSIGCAASEDTNPPVIMNVAVSPAAAGTSATISWDTDELADSRVDYGTEPGDLTQSVSDASLTTAHSLELTDLMPDTDYYFRVTSADALSNSATEPSPPADPAHFWTPDPGSAALPRGDHGRGLRGGHARRGHRDRRDRRRRADPSADGGQRSSMAPALPGGWNVTLGQRRRESRSAAGRRLSMAA